MAVDATKIFVGQPDQGTTGAIFTAATTATLPTDATTALGTGWTASGYVNEDGVSLTPAWTTSDIKDWSGANVRKIVQSFDGKVTFTELELLSEEAAKHAFGDANVTKTAATSSHGEQLSIYMGAELPDPKAWAFNIKDGDAKLRIVIPRGQVSAVDAIAFNRNNAAGLGITIDAQPASVTVGTETKQVSIIVYTDDGIVTA